MTLLDYIKSLVSLYKISFSRSLVQIASDNDYKIDKYIATLWSINDFRKTAFQCEAERPTRVSQLLQLLVVVGSLVQLVTGVALIVLGLSGQVAGGLFFGLVFIISYPLVWAHLLVFAMILIRLISLPKKLGRKVVIAILGRQVKQLQARHKFQIIAVAGSVGKTSTKYAIAQVLESKLKVFWQKGNYNDPVTVPLVFFGEDEPSLFNIYAWVQLFWRNSRQIKRPDYADVVVLELGTDRPGTMAEFAKYLKVDVGILTAISPEHMEFFETIENVAHEELVIAEFSDKLLINTDLCNQEYLTDLDNYKSYGFKLADIVLAEPKFKNRKYSFNLIFNNQEIMPVKVNFLNPDQLYGVAVACAVAGELGLSIDEIKPVVSTLEPVNGRLKPLRGTKNSTILDDSYNSAPEAAVAALNTLYKMKAPQRIAILGSMNELGSYSPEAHRLVAEFCDAKKLDLVVTLGDDANKFLAPVAKNNGCRVKTFTSPYKAGRYVKRQLKSKAVVLVKGSQNGVFAEEAVKILLEYRADEDKLVRQSPQWLAKKLTFFPH